MHVKLREIGDSEGHVCGRLFVLTYTKEYTPQYMGKKACTRVWLLNYAEVFSSNLNELMITRF